MKRPETKFFATVVIAVSACLMSFQALAYEGPYAGLQFGIDSPRDQDYRGNGTSILIAPQPPVPVEETDNPLRGPAGSYKFHRNVLGQLVLGYAYNLDGIIGLRPELELGLRREDVKQIRFEPKLVGYGNVTRPDPKGTRLSTTTVMLNLWFDAFPNWFIHPYIGGGVGGARFVLNNAQFNVLTFKTPASKADDTKFAYQVGAGVNVDVYKGFAVGVDYRYLRSPTVTQLFPYVVQPRSRVGATYATTSLLLSVKYYFDRPEPPAPPAEVVPVAPPPKDTDGDGVYDKDDQCPGTKPGVKVDSVGCALPPPPPPPPPCKMPGPGEKVSLAGCGTGDVIVLRGVNFEFNKSRLTPNAETLLQGVSDQLKQYPSITVEIGGYTDSKGSDSYNQKLSQQRAASVLGYFAGQGIAANRMTAVGYGETHPVADNGTDEGRALNRRVELKITGSDTGSTAVSVEPTNGATATTETPAASSETSAAAATPEAPAAAASSEAPAASSAETPAAPASTPAATGTAPASGSNSNLNDLLGN